MAKKRSKRRRQHRSGTGRMIAFRQLRGVGNLRNPNTVAGALLPPAIGGAVAGAVTLGARGFIDPAQGDMQSALYKHAPWLGMAGGSLAALALYWMGGAPASMSAFASATAVSLTSFGADLVHKQNVGRYAASLSGYGHRARRLGVITAERVGTPSGTGAILFENPASRDPNNRYGIAGLGSSSAFGQDVTIPRSLGGVNANAFGRTNLGG